VTWTSVKTRLPKVPDHGEREPFLIWHAGEYRLSTEHPSWWNYKDKRGAEFNGERVSYWMRLPKPPRAADTSSAGSE
jgi:hypothetical protein